MLRRQDLFASDGMTFRHRAYEEDKIHIYCDLFAKIYSHLSGFSSNFELSITNFGNPFLLVGLIAEKPYHFQM